MTDNKVVPLFKTMPTPDETLEMAKGVYPEVVIIIGYDADGLIDIRSSCEDENEVAMVCQQFLSKLYAGEYSHVER